MKKFLFAIALFASVMANAQVWIGGSVGIDVVKPDYKGSKTIATFSIAPELGISCSENFDVALAWNSSGINYDGETANSIAVEPYAAVAHLWFVAIHPFDDGNGRLTRTITDMLLARADGMSHRFYSMSAEIMRERKSYYEVLEKTTTGDVDITLWLEWFLLTLRSAILRSEATIKRVVKKSMFWQENRGVAMNERQVKVVNKLWDGFEGKLTTSKWAKMTKTSQATALRDINDLIEKGILYASDEGGRSMHYLLKEDC